MLDQVEKWHTSLFSAFKFNFRSWLQVTTELTTDWAVASAFSLLRAVVRIEAVVSKDSNNCIVVESVVARSLINVEQEKQRRENGTLSESAARTKDVEEH